MLVWRFSYDQLLLVCRGNTYSGAPSFGRLQFQRPASRFSRMLKGAGASRRACVERHWRPAQAASLPEDSGDRFETTMGVFIELKGKIEVSGQSRAQRNPGRCSFFFFFLMAHLRLKGQAPTLCLLRCVREGRFLRPATLLYDTLATTPIASCYLRLLFSL